MTYGPHQGVCFLHLPQTSAFKISSRSCFSLACSLPYKLAQVFQISLVSTLKFNLDFCPTWAIWWGTSTLIAVTMGNIVGSGVHLGNELGPSGPCTSWPGCCTRRLRCLQWLAPWTRKLDKDVPSFFGSINCCVRCVLPLRQPC